MSPRNPQRSVLQTFAWPALLAAATLAALILGLLGEGLLDWVAAIGLAAPVAVIAITTLGSRNTR